MYKRWFIFSWELENLSHPVHFTYIRLSGIDANTNSSSRSKSESPWKMTLWIVTSLEIGLPLSIPPSRCPRHSWWGLWFCRMLSTFAGHILGLLVVSPCHGHIYYYYYYYYYYFIPSELSNSSFNWLSFTRVHVLYDLDFFSDFQLRQFSFQVLKICSKFNIYSLLHVPVFSAHWQNPSICPSFFFLSF